MAYNNLNRCIQCDSIIVYSRNDKYKNFVQNNKELHSSNDVKNEYNVEKEHMKCNHINKNGFISKHNAILEVSGNARFLDSTVNDTDGNCNVVATECATIFETFQFSCYKNLKYLNLNGAKVNTLPETMNLLNNLYLLDLSNNYLIDLPRSCVDLHKLRILNLSNNKFTELPPCLLKGLHILKYLNISQNVIKSLDIPPLCLPFLQTLILRNVMLLELPTWFWNKNCHLMNYLNLSGNMCFGNVNYINNIKSAHYMYPSITKNVTSLDISNCGITNIEFLNEFKNIMFLNIGNSNPILRNVLLKLPISAFAEPSKLVELQIDNVDLAALPNKINLFTNLKVLSAQHNKLSWLPENFTQLQSLEVLNLESNQLVMLSNGFSTLTCLKKLYLSENLVSIIFCVLYLSSVYIYKVKSKILT